MGWTLGVVPDVRPCWLFMFLYPKRLEFIRNVQFYKKTFKTFKKGRNSKRAEISELWMVQANDTIVEETFNANSKK